MPERPQELIPALRSAAGASTTASLPGADPATRTSSADRWIVAGLVLLLALVSVAMVQLARYKATPGAAVLASEQWPLESEIDRSGGAPLLLMFAHPRCPCTRASLAELRALMSPLGGRIAATVLFTVPRGATEPWTEGDNRSLAASIPGVRVRDDLDGHESELFGAKTSGHVALYDEGGKLLFSGGITGVRDHVGDNPARQRIAAVLGGERDGIECSPVFGCPLEDAESSDRADRPEQ